MKALILILLSLCLFSCATGGVGAIREMKSTKDGGRIMLIGSNSWLEENSRKRAVASMTAKCPNGYEVVEEGLMERASRDVSLTGGSRVMEKYLEYKCN